MSTWQSELTAFSETSAIFDSISQKGQTEFLFKLESAHIDEKIQFAVWESFGSYLRRQLKQGRSVQIPRFGKFTFTFHTANPNHTVADFTQLKDIRKPIFLISKDFISGKDIKAGIFTEAGITPYPSLSQTGKVQEATLNLVEIAYESGTSKDIVKLCLQRVFREILILVKKNQPVKMDIPSLGTLHIRGGICAVKFYDSIVEDLKIPAIRDSTSSRGRTLVPMSPQTKPYLSVFSRTEAAEPANKPIYIDESASQYLKKELNIEVATLRKATSQSALKRSMFAADNFSREEGWVSAKSSTLYASPTTFQSFDSATYIKRIQLWVKNQRISATEAFYVLMTEVYGIEESGNARLAFEDFGKVLKKLDFKLQPINSKKLFNTLDKNRDGYVDINDWSAIVAGDEAPAKVLNDLLKTRGAKTNKLLEAMSIKKESSFVDKKKLCEGLAALGPNLPKEGINDLVERMLDGKDFIDVDKLIDMVENQQESEKQDYSSWKELIDRVKNFLDQHQHNKKQALFQQIKEASQGKDTLFARDFKFYLSKLAMGLTTTEINKISRRYEIAAGKLVEFKRFYKDVENADDSLNNEICLRNIAVKLQEYIKSKKWETQLFLRKISALSDMSASMEHTRSADSSFHKGVSNKVPISLFGFFLKNNILEQGSPLESDQVAERIDIDGDGHISKEDLETFIARSGLYSKTKLLQSELAAPKHLRLFPTEPLSEQDVQSLLRELRIILDSQRVTNHELFTKLDVNEDGFLTIDEFCIGLEKIIPIPRLITEGFFAYIDKQKVGFLDLESFMKVLKKSVNVKDKKVIRDNFDWPTEVIKKIRNYFEAGGVSKDDAFRIVDNDFDGNIGRADLKHFLTKFMNFSTEDATETRLDRLFKLLDRFKRGCIQLDDFIRIFDDHAQFSIMQQTGSFGNSLRSPSYSRYSAPAEIPEEQKEHNVPFDWMINAKQQIGLVLSQKYESLRAGFDIICGHTGKILFKTFKDWIESNNVLQGFNLTSNLLLLLYAHIDPHKKGYLTFNDWELAFKTFDWNNQLLAEFKNLLYTNFSGLEPAFAHFYLRSGKTKKHGFESNAEFGYLDFVEGLKALLPTRFSQGEIDYIWNKLCNGKWKMTFAVFTHSVEANKFMAKEANLSATGFGASESVGHFTGRSHSSFPRTTLLHKDFYVGKPIPVRGAISTEVFEKLKKNIRSEKSSLIDSFKAADTAKLGRITSVEFRNVMMKLKIGLSNAEIGYLLDLASIDKDGLIDWKAFVDKILLKESDVQLFQRFKDKLNKIRQGIYTYLLTPKDAFAKYNINGTGKLVYEEFVELVGDIYKASNEEVPAVSILRDLFDFIDIKKDGTIDINEWSQTFGQLSILYGKEPVDPRKQAVTLTKALLESHDVDWVNTKNYDDVMIAIGRNRKLLYNRFLNLEQRKVTITYEKTREVIKEILEYSGVKMEERNWGVLIRFAEVRGVVDFRKLLSVFKDRLHKITTIPRMKTIYI